MSHTQAAWSCQRCGRINAIGVVCLCQERRRYGEGAVYPTLTVEEDARPFNISDQPTPRSRFMIVGGADDVMFPSMNVRRPETLRSIAAFCNAQADRIDREEEA